MNDRVLAIIVCYNPKTTALAVSLAAIANQVDATLIVDNASTNINQIKQVVDAAPNTDRLTLVEQDSNLGLGAAHNVGLRLAKQQGFSHVLLLDQDSVPLSDMVHNLLAAAKAKHASRLSAVGASYLNADNGSESFFVRFGRIKFIRQYCSQRDTDGCIEADFLISSGSLIALDTIDSVGEMDESLFVDHVDTEWFLRAKSKGFRAYGVCDAMMQHGLGEQTHRVQFSANSRQRNVPQHKPFRYYYIFRNSVTLYRRDYISGLWKWNDTQRLVLIALMFGVLKAPRWQNLKMMLKGVADGMRGIKGKADIG